MARLYVSCLASVGEPRHKSFIQRTRILLGPPVMSPVATILVVEDEPVVRMAMALELEDAGYRVLQAPDASRAIAILERESSIKVIVTDIDMPGDMDGLQLAHAVRNRWPAPLSTSNDR